MRFTLWTLAGLGALGVILWLAWRWYAKQPKSPALAAVNAGGFRAGFGRLITGMDGSSGASVRAAELSPDGILPPSTGYTTYPGGGLIRQI